MGKTPGGTVKLVKPPSVRSNPKLPRPVLKNRLNPPKTQAIGVTGVGLITRKSLRLSIKSVESPTVSANPEHALSIFINRAHIVVAQATSVCGNVPVVGELLRFPVESFQSAAKSSNPEHALSVFMDCSDIVVTQAIRIGRVVCIDRKAVSIVFVQSILRAEPHKPFTVLQDAVYGALRESLFN